MNTTRKPPYIRDLTPEEDAAITKAALSDPDNPPATAEQLANAKPIDPESPIGKIVFRGRPKLANPKKAISLRVDADVLEYFKADGKGWQTRMNEALRKAVLG